jgi:hypothetical protein
MEMVFVRHQSRSKRRKPGISRRKADLLFSIGSERKFCSLSIMKTPILPLGTAVLGAAIGFIIGNLPDRSVSPDQAREETREAPRRPGKAGRLTAGRKSESPTEAVLSAMLKGRAPGELSAEEAFNLMQPNLSMDFWGGDPLEMARRNYEFQLLLNKLPLPVLEQVMELSRESGTPGYRLQQVFGAYAIRDWEKAMAWAEKQPDATSWKNNAIAKMALTDPTRASELYQQGMLEGTSSMNTWEVGMSLGSAYAKQGKAAYLAFIDSLPSGSASNVLSNSIRNLPKEDLPAVMKEMEQRVADGKIEEWTLRNLISNLAATDPQAANAWIEGMEAGENRSKIEMSLAENLARQGKGSEALALMKNAMAGMPGKEKEFFQNHVGSLVQSNPALAQQLASNLPEGVEITREDLKNIGTYGRNDLMIDVAKLVKSPDEQALYLEESFRKISDRSKLNAKDFQILTHRLQTLGLTGDAATRARQALDEARDKVLGK